MDILYIIIISSYFFITNNIAYSRFVRSKFYFKSINELKISEAE